MSDIHRQITQRIDGFIADIHELARKAALETLAAVLNDRFAQPHRAHRPPPTTRPPGTKRTVAELVYLRNALLEHIAQHPGQRMEELTAALGVPRRELNLPLRKLVAEGRLHSRGHKRATTYYPADAPAAPLATDTGPARAGDRRTSRAGRRTGRRKRTG
jgi:hypothetical protein